MDGIRLSPADSFCVVAFIRVVYHECFPFTIGKSRGGWLVSLGLGGKERSSGHGLGAHTLGLLQSRPETEERGVLLTILC